MFYYKYRYHAIKAIIIIISYCTGHIVFLMNDSLRHFVIAVHGEETPQYNEYRIRTNN
jgi:hypothetical protein